MKPSLSSLKSSKQLSRRSSEGPVQPVLSPENRADRQKFCNISWSLTAGNHTYMLSRTTTLICCRCVLSSVPRLPPIRHPHLTQLPLHLTRSYAKKAKKVPLPPEQLPDHLKQVILGKYLTPNPDTGKLYLKDIEAIRAENNKRLKGHKKGELYMNSIHGRAELISLVMKAIDRSEVQKEWKTNGKLRFLPSHQFYLARAYWILQGPGKWMDRPLPEKLEPEQGHRVKPNRYTLWNSWKYLLENRSEERRVGKS